MMLAQLVTCKVCAALCVACGRGMKARADTKRARCQVCVLMVPEDIEGLIEALNDAIEVHRVAL